MRDTDDRLVRPRIKGRFILERRLRALVLALHRFGAHRAATPADRTWCARAIDQLTKALQV